jgi:putative ABC transport system substrate-binding protein
MARAARLVTPLLVLALLAAPLGVAAQPTGKTVRIGYLSPLTAKGDAAHRQAFLEGLRTLGYVDGQNAVIEARYADGRLDRLPELAAEIVGLRVDVIVAAPSPAVRAARDVTRTIPIVMAMSGDPVGEGFAATLARPGGNVTGHSAAVVEMTVKRVEFLKTIVPTLSQVSYLADPETSQRAVTDTAAAGRTLGLRVSTLLVRNASEVDRAFSTMRDAHVGGVVVAITLTHHWKQILDLALRHRLPTVSGPRAFVEAGGLIAYGPYYPDLFRRAATYVDRILKGAKPADLPVEQPTKFELVVNLKTAKALGLTIPPSILARADEILE